MRVLVGVSLALAMFLSSAPQAAAQTAGCAAVRFDLETQCPCASAESKGKYVKCVKKAFGKKGALNAQKACKKELVKIAKNSICGRAGAAICCRAKGKKFGTVKKTAAKCTSGKKAGVTCDVQSTAAPASVDGAFFNSVNDVCTSAGQCVTTTTTTTTTTSTTTTTVPPLCTPTNQCDPNGPYFEFTTVALGGSCGTAESSDGSKVFQLACGGLNIGGGKSTVLEGPTPDGATNRFLADCDGDNCTICPTPAAGPGFDCTDTGCFFGTPLPIENGGTSTCVVNTFAAPTCGNVNLANGSTENLSVSLASQTFLTGVPGSLYAMPDTVCPVCQNGGTAVNGTPAMPVAGTCNGGANSGMACTSTNSDGLTKDCPPGGAGMGASCEDGQPCADGALNLGALAVDLTPLTTAVANKTAADGLFCPGSSGDPATGQTGCFGRANDMNPGGFPECTTITENGSPAGAPLVDGVPAAVTLATVFCIPPAEGATGGIVNLSANLPGPGATSLPGMLLYEDPSMP